MSEKYSHSSSEEGDPAVKGALGKMNSCRMNGTKTPAADDVVISALRPQGKHKNLNTSVAVNNILKKVFNLFKTCSNSPKHFKM